MKKRSPAFKIRWIPLGSDIVNYETAIETMQKKQSLGMKPGLSNISALLSKMGDPQEKLRIIHIAGTNGKGTVAALISNALSDCGLKTGLFTSPWVVDYREQIQINGSFIPEDRFAAYVERYAGEPVTEFELLTAIMYQYFADEQVDYAVVECGMGGALDATNAFFRPELAVITSVSMDHTAFLGNTVKEIAAQKAGIIKENCVCVLYPNPHCEDVFAQRCKETNSRLIRVPQQNDFKKNNLAVAKECVAYRHQCARLEYPSLPARQEMFGGVMLDGAHNENGARALLDHLPFENIAAVISMMADKDCNAYLKVIAPRCRRIITTETSNPRTLPAENLAAIAGRYCNSVTCEKNPHRALELAKQENMFVLVCGSFFLARDLRKDLI